MIEFYRSKQPFIHGTSSRKSSQKNTGELFSRLEVYLCLFIEVGHQTYRKHVSYSSVSERHQPCRPSARLPCRHVMWCTIEYWQSNQEGPKQPGPHESWRCREVFGIGTLGSQTGEESGWRLPAAARRPLLIRVPLPRPRRLK
jgi:hypothetical protein